jgi:hypothetical protein
MASRRAAGPVGDLARSFLDVVHRPSSVEINTKLTVELVVLFPRLPPAPHGAFFLFGPRGTGKSTWIRTTLADAFIINFAAA